MSSQLMEPDIAAAIAAGRSIIVPSTQRAAALRWNWARVKLAEGKTVWQTPEILTWDAWLDAQWQRARLEGRVAANLRRLNPSQQLKLWQRALTSLAAQFEQVDELVQHSAALMSSAAEAVQWQLPLSRLAVTDEERLLAAALSAARAWCQHHDCVSLSLLTPAQLAEFVRGSPPLIAGQRELTALQAELAERLWPGEVLLHVASAGAAQIIQLRVASDLDEEIGACAEWCRGRLIRNPDARLLIMTAATSPSPETQAMLLARELSAGTSEVPEDAIARGLIAVEGGAVLAHQQLVADALCALRLLREPLSFDDLSRVLRSAYFDWSDAPQWQELLAKLADFGFAQWGVDALRETLVRLGPNEPAATQLQKWLETARAWQGKAAYLEWAQRFSQWLGAARFARGVELDSRDAQRWQRWNELLDEFAALDGINEPQSLMAALEELAHLAEQARHAAQSGDAAITLTSACDSPVARYDGIWVVGLAEQRWPQPPRPDPYIPVSEQRRCGWAVAGARQRLVQAQWSLQQWQAATPELVLSYSRLEGDVHHRPSALPGLALPHVWTPAIRSELASEPFCSTQSVFDDHLAPLSTHPDRPLITGKRRLELQQACAFRAQAEVRLGATAAPTQSDGIHPKARGLLLHGLLEKLWLELKDQQTLKRLDGEGRRSLFARLWAQQVARLASDGQPSFPARVLERERLRSERLVLRVLEIEEQRPSFRVIDGERQLQLGSFAGVLTVRVDRLDEDEQGHYWLIDYKSGKPDTIRLDQGKAQPLQLALYEQALTEQGVNVHGLALLSLAPAPEHLGYSGAAPEKPWPGTWRSVTEWPVQRQRWRQDVAALLSEHVAGYADVAPLSDACRHCHLSALCRRVDPSENSDD